MKITDVRIKVVAGGSGAEKLRGWCSITFDGAFVVRDVKIIEGADGLFLAMPSRRTMDRCCGCGGKNHIQARFCNDCGKKLPEMPAGDPNGGRRVFVDIAHPINAEMRESIHRKVLQVFSEEAGRDTAGESDATSHASDNGWGSGETDD